MANKMIVKNTLKHYYDRPSDPNDSILPEPDKTKSISELSQKELSAMMGRLRAERELQQTIKELKRNAGVRDTYDDPIKVDTKTPINQMYHHGVLGMKWGVRRYQNKDGTRTPTGKRRARHEGPDSDEHMSSRVAKAKGTSKLSNDELRKVNERLQLEESYKRLTKDDLKKSESWVKKSLNSAGEQALTEFSKGVFLGSAKLLVKGLSPEFAETAFNVKEKKKD